jgi:thermitase
VQPLRPVAADTDSNMSLTRNRTLYLLALSLALAAVIWMAASRPALAAPAAQTEPEGQVVLMQFTPETPVELRDAQIAALGGQLLHWLPQIQVAEVRLPAVVTAAALPLSPETVRFVEPDMPVAATALPSDPDLADPAKSYGLLQVHAPAAWEITTGSPDVVVAVVDTGVKLDHPEFAGRVVAGYDFVNEDDRPDDDAGHGTHVAGIIGAGIDDGLGIAGVCPRCRIMPIKVLNARSIGAWSDLAQGILYAVDHGAQIVNLSLGATQSSRTLEAAVAYARRHGVIIVAAAGNHGADEAFYPAALDGVIAVSATTPQGMRWESSNYGRMIDVAAPGDLVYSTFHQTDNLFRGYTYLSGTSMAAPFVSGLAGLLVSLHPALGPGEIAIAIETGADDLGAPGWDPDFGYGRINAARSVRLPVDALSTATGRGAIMSARIFLPTVTTR